MIFREFDEAEFLLYHQKKEENLKKEIQLAKEQAEKQTRLAKEEADRLRKILEAHGWSE